MTQNDKHRVEETYREEKGRLLGFIRSRIPDEEEAEDLMQDVFVRLILNTTGIQTIENITAWIYSVTRNRIIDFFRKKKPESLEDQQINSGVSDTPIDLVDILPALGDGPEDKIFSNLIWEEIQFALDDLPEQQREVFVLHEFENYSMKQIGEISGVNQNTLLARKRYAVLFLRNRLQELYNQINE